MNSINAEKITQGAAYYRDAQFLEDVVHGLSQSPKQLPCKYFYDERGSILFTEICKTEEYYITSTELTLLDEILPDIARLVGRHANIIEYGSGEGRKIRHLLAALDQPKAYIPIDISAEILLRSTSHLKREFPQITIHPVVGDYTSTIRLPDVVASDKHNRRMVFFPGSTISNFSPDEARQFLERVNTILKPGDVLLLGVDLLKSPTRLHEAYNDKEGVTADFNLNLLRRINTELGADFDRRQFEHYAFFNLEQSRIEMHLVSLTEQTVTLDGQQFYFERGETIHTENSYKYTIEAIAELGISCGFNHIKAWTDHNDLFSIHYLTRT
jgi:dimethylhistidine N-methyltransferase